MFTTRVGGLFESNWNLESKWKFENSRIENKKKLANISNFANIFSHLSFCSGHLIRTYLLYYQITSIKHEQLLNANDNRSKPKFLRFLWNIFVFRLVAYLLNIICLNLRFLYNILCIYIWHSFISISRDRNIR